MKSLLFDGAFLFFLLFTSLRTCCFRFFLFFLSRLMNHLFKNLKASNIERKIKHELSDTSCNCEHDVHLRWCNAFKED